MPELTLDGTTIPVAPGGHTIEYEALAPSSRSGSGQLRSGVIAKRPKVPVWTFRTPPLTGSEDTNVKTEVTTQGRTVASGDLIGFWTLSGVLVTKVYAYVRNLRRRTVGPTPDWVSEFELLAAEPIQPETVTALFLVDDGNGFAAMSDTGPDDYDWEDDGNGFAAASDSASGTTFTGYETSAGVTFVDG